MMDNRQEAVSPLKALLDLSVVKKTREPSILTNPTRASAMLSIDGKVYNIAVERYPDLDAN